MSERYGQCPLCRGRGTRRDLITLEMLEEECGRCNGTGFDGSIDARERHDPRPKRILTPEQGTPKTMAEVAQEAIRSYDQRSKK